MGPYTSRVLAAILGLEFEELQRLTGLVPPKARLSRKERHDLGLYLASCLELACLEDFKRRRSC